MTAILRPAFSLFAALTVVCGLAYPLLITGIGQLAFPLQAAGSLIERDGQPIGSRLIGQSFSAPRYFWGRPSATTPMPDNAANSGGSNLGPSNPAFIAVVKIRIDALRAADPHNTAKIPVDLVTTSASGLDPDITRAAAYYQAARVARARGLTTRVVHDLIDKHSKSQYFGFFGEPRVNVLMLNLALDTLQH